LGVNVTSSLGELLTDSVTVFYDGNNVRTTYTCSLEDNELFCGGLPSGIRQLIVNGSSEGYGIYTNSTVYIANGQILRLNITLNLTRLNMTLTSDDTGNYINGVTVTLNNSNTFQNTTVNGSVIFTKVPGGTYNVTFSGNNTDIFFYNNTNTVILIVNDSMAGKLNNVTYSFNETRALINITNSSGSGISGLNITITHSTGQAVINTTNSSGFALFPAILPGNYTLSFNVTQFYNLGYAPQNQTIEVIAGEDEYTNNTFSFILNDTQVLFNITNTSANGLGNVTINLMLGGSVARNGYNDTLNGTTNSSGMLTLRNVVPTAYANGSYTYDLDANASGYGIWKNNAITVNVTNNTVSWNMSALSLTINVYNQSGNVVDESVNISLMLPSSSVAQNTSGSYLNVTGVENVTFNSLYVDNYTINITSSKYFSVTRNVTTEGISEASQEANITLVERTLYINVKNSSGEALEEGANISIVNQTGNSVNGTNGSVIGAKTGVNSSTNLEYVPDGTFVIRINSSKYFSFNWTFNTTDLGDINYTKNFTLYEREITAYVYDFNNSQLITDNTTVSILNSTGVVKNLTGDYLNETTATGSLTLYGIPDGTYTVSANSSNYYVENQTLTTSDQTLAPFTFNFYMRRVGIGYFNVTVGNRSGTRIEGASVYLIYNDTNTTGIGTTDSSGNVILSVNTSVFNQLLNLTANKSHYSTNTTGPHSITGGELKNVTIVINQTECSDGTAYGACSSSQPQYCSNGVLVNNCSLCSCSSGYSCNADGTCSSTGTSPTGGGGSYTPPSGPSVSSCTPDWSCAEWSTCEDGIKTRTCTDKNKCGITSGKPDESRECVARMEITLNPITLKAGHCSTESIKIDNTGDESLLNIKFPSEITIQDCCTLSSTQTISLLGGTAGTIDLQACAYKTTEKGNYSYSLSVTSDKLTRTVRSYVYISKNYVEVLLDQILEINASLNALNIETLDAIQLSYYSLAKQSLADARNYALINNFEMADKSIEDARNYLTKIEERAKLDYGTLLLLAIIIIPVGIVFVFILRRTVLSKGVYEYKPPPFHPAGTVKTKVSVISQEAKNLLLTELNKLNEKISSIDTERLSSVDMHYHDLAKDALEDVKTHILSENITAAKEALTDAHNHIKMIEDKL
jgi:hypothetical protein